MTDDIGEGRVRMREEAEEMILKNCPSCGNDDVSTERLLEHLYGTVRLAFPGTMEAYAATTACGDIIEIIFKTDRVCDEQIKKLKSCHIDLRGVRPVTSDRLIVHCWYSVRRKRG